MIHNFLNWGIIANFFSLKTVEREKILVFSHLKITFFPCKIFPLIDFFPNNKFWIGNRCNILSENSESFGGHPYEKNWNVREIFKKERVVRRYRNLIFRQRLNCDNSKQRTVADQQAYKYIKKTIIKVSQCPYLNKTSKSYEWRVQLRRKGEKQWKKHKKRQKSK